MSQIHTVDIYQLERNIWICKGGREEFNFFAGGISYSTDSCYFVMRITSEKDKIEFLSKFKEFLAIYTFVFDDPYPIRCHESGKFSAIKIKNKSSIEAFQKFIQKENLKPGIYPVNFNNVGKNGYTFSHFPDYISFEKFYKIFLGMGNEIKDLFYTFIFDPSVWNSNNVFYKTSFLEIALKYVIVEKILCGDRRSFCESVINKCNVCEREDIKHDKVSLNQLVRSGLENFVKDDEIRIDYVKYVEMAKEIRNNLFHTGVMDKARHNVDEVQPGETLAFDFEKTKEYRENFSSLLNLKMQIFDISRYLLFAYAFNIRCFPKLKMMSAVRLCIK